MTKTNEYKKDLKPRHIFFIALGAAIGTGLFLGSATAIHQTGPSVLFAYIICGISIFFTMRAMGEMALQAPELHTFGSHASKFLSPFAGFTAGWSYVMQMACVCLADITAFATYMGFWYPNVSPWIWTLALALIICAINLSAVKIYGELEFILSSVKVIAIFTMILGGLYLIYDGFNSVPCDFSDIHKVTSWSYWFPNGLSGFIKCLPLVIYSFGGIEVIGITATEAKDPKRSIPKAMNAIPFRIVFFYVMVLGILINLKPWQEISTNGSPFVTICSALGIHSTANLVNILVITAAVSAINSDIYGSSRMIYSLSREGHAFKKLNKLSSLGTPVYAIFVMLTVLVSGIIFNYLKHDGLFVLMADLAAVASLIGWIIILSAEIGMRIKLKKQNQGIIFPVPLWPVGSLLSILFMVFSTMIMSYSNITAFWAGVAWMAYLAIVYYGLKHFDKSGKLVYKKPITNYNESKTT